MASEPPSASSPEGPSIEGAFPEESVRHHRLEFLDAVRGIAALSVLLGHVFEFRLANRGFLFSYFNPGAAGVSAFFLVSGFVIPLSLERQADLRRFWTSRFFRVYPLYLFTLLVVTVWVVAAPHLATYVGKYPESLPSNFLINLTMLQHFLHRPSAVGSYWTLSYELAFYAVCSVLFVLGALKRSDLLVWLCAAMGLASVVSGLRGGASLSYNALVVTMFAVGILTYHITHGAIERRAGLRALLALGVAWGVAIAIVAPRLERYSDQDPTRLCQLYSFTVGYALFFGLYALRHRSFPRLLTWLGEISYSVYLIHGVLFTFGLPGGPFVKGSLVVLLTLLISPLTHRYIEKPGVSLGKRLARRAKPQPA